MAPLAERLASARRIADGRRVIATDIERALRTRFTADTLRRLRKRFPRADFTFVIGADNLLQLPRWKRWRGIARGTALAVLPRPGFTRAALRGQAAQALRRHRARRGRCARKGLRRTRLGAWFRPESTPPPPPPSVRRRLGAAPRRRGP